MIASIGDHPRVCGEKLDVVPLACRGGGSPPRVRGKVKAVIVVGTAEGITPACAGKRLPLVCGVKSW